MRSTQPSSECVLTADKTRWRDVDRLFPCSPEVMNEQSYTFTPPMHLRGLHRGKCNSFFFIFTLIYLFIPYFFCLYFLLLIAISVSVGVPFGTQSRLQLIVSDLRHVKVKRFSR